MTSFLNEEICSVIFPLPGGVIVTQVSFRSLHMVRENCDAAIAVKEITCHFPLRSTMDFLEVAYNYSGGRAEAAADKWFDFRVAESHGPYMGSVRIWPQSQLRQGQRRKTITVFFSRKDSKVFFSNRWRQHLISLPRNTNQAFCIKCIQRTKLRGRRLGGLFLETSWETVRPHRVMDRNIDHVRLGKFLSYVLRYRPDTAGVALDSYGCTQVGFFLAGTSKPPACPSFP